MSNALSDQDLAEHFANFFVDKIMKIWNELDQYVLYEPRLRDLLTTFKMFNLDSRDLLTTFNLITQ